MFFINISRLYSPSSAQGRLAECVALHIFHFPELVKDQHKLKILYSLINQILLICFT